MTVLDELLAANRDRTERPTPIDTVPPRRQLTLITCMDARLDLLGNLGLELGDAHVLRNAGGIPTPDVLRSLAISQTALNTRSVALIQHTSCGMSGFDDDRFRAELAERTGAAPTWDVPGFSDVRASVRSGLETIRTCPWVPHRDQVRGFVYDVATGELAEVE